MKIPALAVLIAFGVALVTAGCANLDMAPAGDPNRVLTGTVNFGTPLPAGSEILVRIIDTTPAESTRAPANNDLAIGDRAKPVHMERVVGEQIQKIEVPISDPLPFRIEYFAEDSLLRRGLNVEARITAGGKVRFRTINAHVITLSSARLPQELSVQQVQ
jgi:uncharacterized lipoprotein YbaY